MPYIETPRELAEAIADLIGVYGGGEDHPDDCKCRMCFVDMIEKRIWRSVENGARLGVDVPEYDLFDSAEDTLMSHADAVLEKFNSPESEEYSKQVRKIKWVSKEEEKDIVQYVLEHKCYCCREQCNYDGCRCAALQTTKD